MRLKGIYRGIRTGAKTSLLCLPEQWGATANFDNLVKFGDRPQAIVTKLDDPICLKKKTLHLN